MTGSQAPIPWELSCFMQQKPATLDSRTSEVLGFPNSLEWAQIFPLLVLLVYPQVTIRFADSVRKPGEPTRLIITAAAGSLVAVTAVDKSVHLLKGGNELTEDDVRELVLLNACIKVLFASCVGVHVNV